MSDPDYSEPYSPPEYPTPPAGDGYDRSDS
jgi:hypothetical protein